MSRQPLKSVNPGTFAHPADRARLAAPDLPVEPTPILSFQSIAVDVTTAQMKKMYGSAFERVRVSDVSGFLEHEHEPGWGPMFRLTIGKTYEVQVFKVKGPVLVYQVPYDQRSPTEAIFYSQAQRALGERDSLDRRRVLKASLALWTDGLGLRVFEPEQLEADTWYQVTLREVPMT